jgi:Domain of unknown function (DUF4234)
MAETVTVNGQNYTKRSPLAVLGLSFITLGIYFFVWYYKINNELRRSENDQTISPGRSVLAMTLGWALILPPFIAMYNTAKHVRAMEARLGVQQGVEPSFTILFLVAFAFGNGMYLQEHLNRAWGAAGAPVATVGSPGPATPVLA